MNTEQSRYTVFEHVFFALSRQFLYNGGIKTDNERDMQLYGIAMQVVYDERGLIRGRDYIDYPF